MGCIPIPFPRNAVVQPELQIQVVDQDQKNISGAQVFFISISDPHSQVHHHLALSTDEKGHLVIPEQKKFEWIFPLMMHGIPFYRYRICTYKEGYITKYTDIDIETQSDQRFMITLEEMDESEIKKQKTNEITSDSCMQRL